MQGPIGSGEENASAAATFSMGQTAKATPDSNQSKAQQLEEKRKKEMFAVDTDGMKSKRSRQEFAEKLRKERRDDFIKQKRQAQTSAEAQSSTEANMEDEIQQKAKQQVSIDQAMSMLNSMPFEQFIATKETLAFDINEFQRIIQLLMQGENEQIRFLGCLALRKLLSLIDGPPYQATVDAGAIPQLVQLGSRFDFAQLQHEAIWCLTNIASDDQGLVQVLVNNQILPMLKMLLMSDQVSVEVVEQVIWCYGNIAGENLTLRDMILADGVVSRIGEALDRVPANSSALRNIAWCLANFMKGKVPAQLEAVVPGVPSLIRALQRTENVEAINDIVWGLSFFTQDGALESLQSIANAGGLPKLIQLIEHANIQIAVPCIRIVGNFLSSSDTQISSQVIDLNILRVYASIIDHPKQIMRKEVAWSLANITAESAQRVKDCIDAGLINSLILHMQHDVALVKRESVWALTNAFYRSTPELAEKMVQMGYFTASNYALELADPKIVFVALEGIASALKQGQELPHVDGENPFVLDIERCGLLDKIEDLQQHENQQVYDKVSEILAQYFQSDDDEYIDSPDPLPVVDGGQSQGQQPSYQQLFEL